MSGYRLQVRRLGEAHGKWNGLTDPLSGQEVMPLNRAIELAQELVNEDKTIHYEIVLEP